MQPTTNELHAVANCARALNVDPGFYLIIAELGYTAACAGGSMSALASWVINHPVRVASTPETRRAVASVAKACGQDPLFVISVDEFGIEAARAGYGSAPARLARMMHAALA